MTSPTYTSIEFSSDLLRETALASAGLPSSEPPPCELRQDELVRVVHLVLGLFHSRRGEVPERHTQLPERILKIHWSAGQPYHAPDGRDTLISFGSVSGRAVLEQAFDQADGTEQRVTAVWLGDQRLDSRMWTSAQ